MSWRNKIFLLWSSSSKSFQSIGIAIFMCLMTEGMYKLPNLLLLRGCPHGVTVKAMDYGIVVSKFVLQLRYYIHFQANTLGKGMNPLILPAMG